MCYALFYLTMPYIAADNYNNYDRRIDVCCSGKVQVRVDNALCCGTKAYDSSVRICCDGVLNWKGRTNASCTFPYDTDTAICCRGQIVAGQKCR